MASAPQLLGANLSRRSDNRPLQVLCKTDALVALLVLFSKLRTASRNPDAIEWDAVASRLVRELRLVIARKPRPFMPDARNPQYLLAYVTETLECGHELDFHHHADPLIAKRRICPECTTAAKKPVQSVRFPARNKEAA